MLGGVDSTMGTSNAVVCGNAENTDIIVKVSYTTLMFALGKHCEPFCKICFDICLPFYFLRRLCSIEKEKKNSLGCKFRNLTTNGSLKGVIIFIPLNNELLACLKDEINSIQSSRK